MKMDAVDQALADGKLWRAKEVLQGRLSSPGFCSDVLHRYGEVLLAMGDKLEAGRMLFCSGVRRSEYNEAIDLFLSRNSRDNPVRFLSALPVMLRRQVHLAGFIASPAFEVRGWTPEMLGLIRPVIPKTHDASGMKRQGWREKVRSASGIAIVIGLFIPFILGIVTILRFLWSFLAH